MSKRTINSFDNFDGYIKLETPIDLGDCVMVGWFPYEVARIFFDGMVKVTRSIFTSLENQLIHNNISDNKHVIILKSKFRAGDTDFAIYFKDMYAIIGNLDNIVDYTGKELKEKQN